MKLIQEWRSKSRDFKLKDGSSVREYSITIVTRNERFKNALEHLLHENMLAEVKDE